MGFVGTTFAVFPAGAVRPFPFPSFGSFPSFASFPLGVRSFRAPFSGVGVSAGGSGEPAGPTASFESLASFGVRLPPLR